MVESVPVSALYSAHGAALVAARTEGRVVAKLQINYQSLQDFVVQPFSMDAVA